MSRFSAIFQGGIGAFIGIVLYQIGVFMAWILCFLKFFRYAVPILNWIDHILERISEQHPVRARWHGYEIYYHNVDMDNRLVALDLYEMGESLRPTALVVTLEAIQNRVAANRKGDRPRSIKEHVKGGTIPKEKPAGNMRTDWKN